MSEHLSLPDSFVLALLEQWYENAPTEEAEYAEVTLYDPESRSNMYHACPSVSDSSFVLYKVFQWEEEPDGLIIPTVIEDIERYSTLSELCKSIVELAKKERLHPQLGLFTDDGEI